MLGSPSSEPALVSGAGAANVVEGERTGFAPPALLQYWQIVRRWKWVIVGIVMAALVVGLLATMLATREYTATSRIEISREQKKITNVDGVESNSPGQDLEFYQTQHSLLRARSLAERVARSLRLANDEGFFEAHGVEPAADAAVNAAGGGASSAERERRERLAVDLLLSHITITPVRGSALVDISYTSASPDMSARIANAWVQQFVVQSMDRRFASTSDARAFLEGRLSDLRTRLEKSERDLVNYAANKGIVPISRSKNSDGRTEVERTLVSSDLEALNTALIAATADRIAAESRANRRGQGESAEALTNPAISTLRQKRAEVAAEYAKLMVRFEPGYPAARELAEQLKTLDASIAREEGRVAGSRQLSYAEALQREQQLRQRVEALKRGLNQQQQDSIQYNIYQREADTNRQLYDGLLQRYKEIGVAGVGASNIAVVDPAKVPTRPSSPNLLLNLALALVIGLGLAAATTFALDQIDEGLRDPSRVNQLLHVPLLGSVPDLGNENALEQVRDTKSTLSEAYLSIRSSLAFSTDHGIPRSLMITSTRAGEGKSTTSFALATILGRTGKNVLLLDADMRSPSMHVYVGTNNANGLSNFLAGEDDWQKLVVPAGERGLSFIPAGPMPPSAAELLSSDRMAMLVSDLVKNFDHIVIDAPPILGLADAPLLARTVEGSVFVIEADGVAIRGIRTSLARLHNVHAHILGVVITKLKQQHSGYGYGYGYGYNYGADANN